MLTYEKAIKSPKLFRAITGMTRPQFDLLYADVETKYDEAETAKLSKRARERDIGAGRGCPRLRAISRSNLRKNHPKS